MSLSFGDSSLPLLSSIRFRVHSIVSGALKKPATTLGGKPPTLSTCTSVTDSDSPLSSPTFPSTQSIETPAEHTRIESALVSHVQSGIRVSHRGDSSAGIDWPVAEAGLRLWLTTHEQAGVTTRDPVVLRSMYIDALKYMHMALPNDLSQSEVVVIRNSLPALVLQSSDRTQHTCLPGRFNILRRSVAWAVCWLMLLMLTLIPLLMSAVNKVMKCERQHRVLYRTLKKGAALTNNLSKRMVYCSGELVRFGDTALGHTCLRSLTWLVEGVAGGLHDGLLEGTNGCVRLIDQ